jgi:hypothetical protein
MTRILKLKARCLKTESTYEMLISPSRDSIALIDVYYEVTSSRRRLG